jgi:3-oxoadipate enol-lactonase
MLFTKIKEAVHHYAIEGASHKRALVFANSLGSDLRIWDTVASRLADGFRIVRYDHRGHGLSDAPEPPYSIDDLAQDLVGLLNAAEIDDAVLCGISVGGLIAQHVALVYPNHVTALVLCDTGARIGSFASWEERIATVKDHGLEALVVPSMERWFTPAFREHYPTQVRGYSNMLLRTTVDGYLGTCCALRDADLRHEVAQIQQPALVLCGDLDVATPPGLGQELARLIPRAQFSLVPQAAHLPCIEKPGTVVDRMMQFLREVKLV